MQIRLNWIQIQPNQIQIQWKRIVMEMGEQGIEICS
jgi:hypothetical protein